MPILPGTSSRMYKADKSGKILETWYLRLVPSAFWYNPKPDYLYVRLPSLYVVRGICTMAESDNSDSILSKMKECLLIDTGLNLVPRVSLPPTPWSERDVAPGDGKERTLETRLIQAYGGVGWKFHFSPA